MALFTVLEVVLGFAQAYGEGLDEKLSLSSRQSHAIMEKAAVLEEQIQRRQRQAVRTEDTIEYQAGFSDGYNKAILDLVKARLLNDKSLLPKPMQRLQRASYASPPAPQSEFERSQRGYTDQTLAAPRTEKNLSPEVQPDTQRQLQFPDSATDVPQTQGVPAPGDTQHNLSNTSVTDVDSTVTITTVETVAATVATTATTPAQATVKTTAASASPVIVTSPVITSGMQGTDTNAATPPSTSSTIDLTTNPKAATLEPIGPVSQQPHGANITVQPKETAQRWLQKSNAYLKEKNWQQAISAATTALALDAGMVDSYIVRSWAYAEKGESKKALDDTSAAMRLDPNNALAYNNTAYVYELTNDRSKAQENYQKACALHYQPACETVRKFDQIAQEEKKVKVDRLTQLSYTQFEQKAWKAVIKTTTELLELDPDNTTALANRAGAYTELGLYNKALDDCNNALIIDPDMGIAYNNKGYALELMQQPKKAALEYETACVLGVKQSCSDFKRLSHKGSSR